MKVVAPEAGFSATLLTLGLCAVIALLASGYMVYKANQPKAVASVTTAKVPARAYDPNATTSSAGGGQNLIKLPELGIELTVPGALSDLTYSFNASANPTTDSYGSTENTAGVSTQSLSGIDNNCSAPASALGDITTGSGEWPPSVDPSKSMAPLLYEAQLPNLWVAYNNAHFACSQNVQALNDMQVGIAQLRAALQVAQPLQ